MIRIPEFKHQFRIATTHPDLVFFIGESGYRVIQGRILYQITPLINGKRGSFEIAKHFKGRLKQADVELALLLLEAEGFLTEAEKVLRGKSKKSETFNWTGYFQSAKNSKLEERALAKMPALHFVDDYLQKGLETFNKTAIKKKKRWMIAKTTGTVLWFGPVFLPPDGPCWKCLAIRLKEKRRVDSFLKANRSREIRSALRSNTEMSPALGRKVFERLFRQSPPGLLLHKGEASMCELITFDAVEKKFERHTVIRREECPECGNIKRPFPQPIRLKKNAATTQNESTFDKYKHHISLRTGIVDELTIIGNHPAIHAASTDHLFVPNLEKEDLLQKGLTQKSWGKGCTRDQAQTSALCEALERYSGVFRGNEFRVTKSAEQLGSDAIPIHNCLNFSDAQYANREQINKTAQNHDWVPVPLDPARKIEWTPVWSLTNHKFRYLPTAYCYYGYSLPVDRRFCRADSNGNAAGETLEIAILNGFLELVERDCTAMWWFNRAPRPSVRIDSFPVPYLHDLMLAYKNLNHEIWALDLTNDFGIPCFAALSTKKNGPAEILMGFGADLNPMTALIRAITEMNQFLAVRLTTARSSPAVPHRKPPIGNRTPAAKYLRPCDALPILKFEDYKNKSAEDPYKNLQTCVRLAKKLGMETFVLDQTRSDVGLPVVKVIVPGMRQFWRRFAPGRLYDVPVRFGWIKQPLMENELNSDRFMN